MAAAVAVVALAVAISVTFAVAFAIAILTAAVAMLVSSSEILLEYSVHKLLAFYGNDKLSFVILLLELADNNLVLADSLYFLCGRKQYVKITLVLYASYLNKLDGVALIIVKSNKLVFVKNFAVFVFHNFTLLLGANFVPP